MGGLDQDPKLAAQTRQFLLQKLTSEYMGLVGFHLLNGGIGKVEKLVKVMNLWSYKMNTLNNQHKTS